MMARTRALTLPLVLAASVAAQSFQDCLPKDSLMFVTLPHISASLDKLQGMPIAKMWQEQQVQDFLAAPLKMVAERWEEGMAAARAAHEQGQLPIDPELLLELRVESVSFALTSLEIVRVENDIVPAVGLVIHFGFGESAEHWRKLIDIAIGTAMQQAPEGAVVQSVGEVGGTQLHTVAPNGPNIPLSLNYAFVGDGLVIGTITDEVKAFLVARAGGGGGLATAEDYRQVAAKLDPTGAEAESFLRPAALIEFLLTAVEIAAENQPGFPPEIQPAGIRRAVEALGLLGLTAHGSTSRYEGDQCVTRSYTLIPAASRRGLFAGEPAKVSLDFLKWVPKDAVAVNASQQDLGAVYDSLLAAVQAYDPEVAEAVLAQLGAIEEQTGVRLKQDLFQALEGQIVTWMMPVAFGASPEYVMLARVRDQERLVATLRTITAMSQGKLELKEIERRGVKAYQLDFDIQIPQLPMNPLDAFTPTFAFKDGYLVAAMSTGDVRRAFRRMEREDDPEGDIRTSPIFAPLLAQLPPSGVTSFSFSDWRAQFESAYQMLTGFAAFLPMDDTIPLDIALLPESMTLTKHLSGSMAWCIEDDDGFASTSRGPWGPEAAALLLGGVGAGVATWMTLSGM